MPTPATTTDSVLVAAFEPFEGRRRNRAWEAVRRLPPAPGLETTQLPVVFSRLPAEIAALRARRPRALLLVGEARRFEVSVEQVALNLADGPDRPDNEGAIMTGQPLVEATGAPLALRASWNAHAVAALMRREGIPAAASFHAGTFACNASLYLALHQAPAPAPAVGFLHLPQARWPRGPRLRTLIRAVQIAAQELASVGTRTDR